MIIIWSITFEFRDFLNLKLLRGDPKCSKGLLLDVFAPDSAGGSSVLESSSLSTGGFTDGEHGVWYKEGEAGVVLENEFVESDTLSRWLVAGVSFGWGSLVVDISSAELTLSTVFGRKFNERLLNKINQSIHFKDN